MAETTNHHSLFPLETCPQVADEAFRQFHTIDRELYACLTRSLRRDPAESVHVMAFLMWLERECRLNLIKQMASLPPILLNQLANEAAVCMKCVESDAFLFGDSGEEIKIISEYVNFPAGVGLRFFHENRIAVLRGVGKIINTVCWRAFGDLFQPTWEAGMKIGGGEAAAAPLHAMQFVYNPYLDVLPVVPLPAAVAGGALRMPPPPLHVPHRPPMMADAIGLPVHMLAAGGFPVYDGAAQRQMLASELGDMVRNNLNINKESENSKEKEVVVAADDRTIFLTFSKGYPTTEEEVRDYFTRRFGDFIESLIMQEVEEGEQPLYAKMVARSTAVIDGIVEGNKAKYSINGKHVWARKYVKKPTQLRSPPRGEASGSSPAKKA